MAKAIQEAPEKTQGQIGAEEAATAVIPIPEEESPLAEAPTEEGEAPQEEAAPVPQPPQPAGFRPQSFMETVPANILFNQNKPMKTPLQQRNDMGIFWKSLAAKPDAPPIIKAIARELAGE